MEGVKVERTLRNAPVKDFGKIAANMIQNIVSIFLNVKKYVRSSMSFSYVIRAEVA